MEDLVSPSPEFSAPVCADAQLAEAHFCYELVVGVVIHSVAVPTI